MGLTSTTATLATLLALLLPPSARCMCAPGAVVGIDLGTTSSAVAIISNGLPEVVVDAAGKKSMPSCVTIGEDRVLAGHLVDDVAIRSSKRVIGLTHTAATSKLANRPLLLAEQLVLDGEEDELALRCETEGPTCTPTEVAQHIISALLDRAEASCGVRASRAIIGVPTHFSDKQREETLAAAREAPPFESVESPGGSPAQRVCIGPRLPSQAAPGSRRQSCCRSLSLRRSRTAPSALSKMS